MERNLRSVVSSGLTKHGAPTTSATFAAPPEEQHSVVRQVGECRGALNVTSHLLPLTPPRRASPPFPSAV